MDTWMQEKTLKMEIVYNDQVNVAARCLQAGLNRGRMSSLHSALDDIWDGSNIGRHFVVAAVEGDVFIGCATFSRRSKLVQVFVKEEHRRKGIGSRLITALEEVTGVPRQTYTSRPDEETVPFFDKNHVMSDPSDGGYPLSKEETTRILENPYEAAKIIRKKRREYRRNWLERISKK